MKTKTKYILPLAAMGMAMGLAPQCLAGGPGSGMVMAPIVETQPAYYDVTTVTAPADYVWDGYDNVGMANGQYYFLAPNNVWMPLNTVQQRHFDDWQRSHLNGYDHAIHNTSYQTVEYRGQLVNCQPTEYRQDQDRNSPINRTDQSGPLIRAEQDHNGPPE
jgi:hypothetical protein